MFRAWGWAALFVLIVFAYWSVIEDLVWEGHANPARSALASYAAHVWFRMRYLLIPAGLFAAVMRPRCVFSRAFRPPFALFLTAVLFLFVLIPFVLLVLMSL